MEISYELCEQDFPGVMRALKRRPWAAMLTALVLAPSLGALWWAGYRVLLAVVAAALLFLTVSAIRSAQRAHRIDFRKHQCLPATLRLEPEFCELDNVVEWQRYAWSQIGAVADRAGWLVIRFREGGAVAVPPRAFTDKTRAEALELARRAMADSQPETDDIPANPAKQPREARDAVDSRPPLREWDGRSPGHVSYVVDREYVRQLMLLRKDQQLSWWLPLSVASITALLALAWKSSRRSVLGAGLAVMLPMVLIRVFEEVVHRRMLRAADATQPVHWQVLTHDDGVELRCDGTQTFKSWGMLRGLQRVEGYVLLQWLGDSPTIIPDSAWPSPESCHEFLEDAQRRKDELDRELNESAAEPENEEAE
ncbi:MAG: hypothetical protein KDB14_30965 [Planctomycetales bacterium]|nr:hypothetical protein [Planctomycetales bacterium]